MALVGVRDDAARPARLERRRAEGRQQLRVIVTVHLAHVPAERPPLVRERLQAHGRLGAVALLETVAVDDDGEPVEPEVAGRHRRFPHRALLQLAVAGEHERPPVRPVELRGERDAHGHRQPVPEWTGVGLDAGQLRSVGVPAQA